MCGSLGWSRFPSVGGGVCVLLEWQFGLMGSVCVVSTRNTNLIKVDMINKSCHKFKHEHDTSIIWVTRYDTINIKLY